MNNTYQTYTKEPMISSETATTAFYKKGQLYFEMTCHMLVSE